MTCRKQEVALVRIEGELVDLTCMLMQSDKLHVGTIEVVQDDFAVGNSSRYMRAELAMRPFHILDAQALTLPCIGVCIIEDSSSQVGVIDDLDTVYFYRLKNLFASKHGMCPLTIDVKCRDVKARLVGGIKGVASPHAALQF